MAKLYLVPTPIGNLDDMTFRAIKVLKEVDLILAEDTRTSSKLLHHFEIQNKLSSHHKFNEHQTASHIAQRIESGENIALISDAGTPGISDPGFLLVKNCLELGVQVECLPGATALIPALVNSGLPCDRFCFEGFLPQKKGRQKKLLSLQNEERTLIFYESPYRLIKTLEQFCEFMGEDRQVSVSRELSKLFEENYRGTVKEALEHFKAKTVKGEIVIVLEGKTGKTAKDDE
ncbi:16S rRNA (cytidine(1402)-2'-O)-methyltransferase [Mangrovibacterium sp.]|uniref:16S rRNA (cytidine(1402)-2'-O)-methyltransferase n=1 Tax=Mangrovibacterium sp. TaxID=1961364 RepID=UPI003562DDAF